MDQLTQETVELEEQYNNHISRLDGELKELIAELRMVRDTAVKEIRLKEKDKKDKLSFKNIFKKGDDDDDSKKNNNSEEENEELNKKDSDNLTSEERLAEDEKKLAEIERKREEEKLNKNKKQEEVPAQEKVRKISRKEQAVLDQYDSDLKKLLEKYNLKCADLHDLFIDKIIALEEKFGIDTVRKA